MSAKKRHDFEREHGFEMPKPGEEDEFYENYEPVNWEKLDHVEIINPTDVENDEALKMIVKTRGNFTPEQWASVTDWRPEKVVPLEHYTVSRDDLPKKKTKPVLALDKPLAAQPENIKFDGDLLSVNPLSLLPQTNLALRLEVEQFLQKTKTLDKWRTIRRWSLQYSFKEFLGVPSRMVLWFFSSVYKIFVAAVMENTTNQDWSEAPLCFRNYLFVPQIKSSKE